MLISEVAEDKGRTTITVLRCY